MTLPRSIHPRRTALSLLITGVLVGASSLAVAAPHPEDTTQARTEQSRTEQVRTTQQQRSQTQQQDPQDHSQSAQSNQPGMAMSDQKIDLNQTDRAFIDKAISANATGIALGKLAVEKGGDEVKEFGQQMVDDHQQTLNTLFALSPQQSMTTQPATQPSTKPSAQPYSQQRKQELTQSAAKQSMDSTAMHATAESKLTAEQQKTIDELKALSGDAFDRKFTEVVLQKHRQDLNTFQTASNNMQYSQPVREFIQETTPTLREHLQAAQDLPDAEQIATVPED